MDRRSTRIILQEAITANKKFCSVNTKQFSQIIEKEADKKYSFPIHETVIDSIKKMNERIKSQEPSIAVTLSEKQREITIVPNDLAWPLMVNTAWKRYESSRVTRNRSLKRLFGKPRRLTEFEQMQDWNADVAVIAMVFEGLRLEQLFVNGELMIRTQQTIIRSRISTLVGV